LVQGTDITECVLKWTGGDLNPLWSGDVTRDSLFFPVVKNTWLRN